MDLRDTRDVQPQTVSFRSKFGGLWTDLSNAGRILAGKRELGHVSDAEVARLEHWMEHGFVVIEQAVAPELVDRVCADIDRAWEGTLGPLQCEAPADDVIKILQCAPEYRSNASKLLNLHGHSEAARDAVFAPAMRRFLELVFERPALAFQSLQCEIGTRQPMHQDTAYVGVSSPMELVASWIALEDIVGECGQLEYYVGSHRIPETVFLDDSARLMPLELRSNEEYFHHLEKLCAERGLERRQFSPKKGDALFWSADLVHGGSFRMAEGSTRRSLVTHYCPHDLDPVYFAFWRHSEKLKHAPGCYYCYDVR